MKRFLSVFLLTIFILGITFTASACKGEEYGNPFSLLQVDGTKIVDDSGAEVCLRGVNVGGISAIEQWMNGFLKSSAEDSDIVCRDHLTTTRVFVERFGKERTKEIWAEYKRNWFNDYDFQNCVDMGLNVLRLPFTYMDLDFDAILDLDDGGKAYDFTFLDEFIEKCRQYGLYVILDMHGAYGSQNGKDHSGEVVAAGKVDFYSNEQKIQLTANLWKAIAERYKDEPTVAGYDLLNEPAETTGSGTLTTSDRHFLVFDKIYDAIRSTGDNHIIFFESCWGANDLPTPQEYGWTNCVYSFHHYTGTDDLNSHASSFTSRVAEITEKDFGVPIYMGEFTCYNNYESWDYTLALMNAQRISWTSWTYKVNATSVMPWGVYNIKIESEQKINAHKDSYEEIIAKIKKLSTKENAKAYTFSNQKTLASIIKKYALAGGAVDLSSGNYYIRTSDYKSIKGVESDLAGRLVVIKGEDKWDGGAFRITVGNGANKSIKIRNGGYFLTTYEKNGVKTMTMLSRDDDCKFLFLSGEYGYRLLSCSDRKFAKYDAETGTFIFTASYNDAEDFIIEKA